MNEKEEIEMKKDITRLKNLLTQYRDHMITKRHSMSKYEEITETIGKIDRCISIIKGAL